MPSRNIVREFEADAYYHVYNRGVEKRAIFLDAKDVTVLLGLLKKYLVGDTRESNKGNRHKFPVLESEVRLLTYCLMKNHFHLLFYQASAQGVEKLMRRVMTGYEMYFNSRYNRVGSLFQGPYKASRVTSDAYLLHISRYIHLNPKQYRSWPDSSYSYYAGAKTTPVWLDTELILGLFNGRKDYLAFLDEYVDTKHELDSLKWQLANDIDRGEM